MSISKKTFIKKYSDAIIRDEAAVFAGAGYSKEAGFCNWKELLKDVAEDLNLSIEKESDYISLAQYYENKNGYNILCNTILDRFSKYKNNYTIAKVIESLPIKTYWTTNFDHFIEDTLKYDFNKNVDVKKSNMNLTCNLRNRDATVYKFHGDIDDFSSLVITKSDYEEFENKSLPFINALNGDLISKTFVFVGYSFNDPDLFNVLKNVHLTYDKNKRIHYALIKRVSENDYNDKDEYNYELIKYKLKIQDLKRYGIETVEIDDFKEIVEIFINIKKRYLINNIYIAGSCRKLPNNWTQTSADMFLYNLGYKLAKENFKICTGCIEGVGPQFENGVLNSVFENDLSLNNALDIKRLPLINGNLDHMNNDSKNVMRNEIYKKNGIVIFLFGNQYYDGKLQISKGVMNDYFRAKNENMYLIPVGSTGGASNKISSIIKKEIENYSYLKNSIETLCKSTEPEILIDEIFNVINNIQNL